MTRRTGGVVDRVGGIDSVDVSSAKKFIGERDRGSAGAIGFEGHGKQCRVGHRLED